MLKFKANNVADEETTEPKNTLPKMTESPIYNNDIVQSTDEFGFFMPQQIYPHLMPQNFMKVTAQKMSNFEVLDEGRSMPRSSSGGSVLV